MTLATGFCAYMITANEIRPNASTVCRESGIPSKGTLSKAVNTNSRADAKALRMELSFLRKRLVTIPRTELFRIKRTTSGWLIEDRADEVKALVRSP